jgi:phospholipase D
VCFSPEGNCQPIILNLINNAKAKILVQSYSFTSIEIANALIKAHKEGIKVKILFDRSQLTARHSQIHKMRETGIEALVDLVPGISHNKIMIIDEEILLTGSYNWTNAAETRNAENLLIIKNRPTAKIYIRNWKKRYERAKKINLQNLAKRSLPHIPKPIKPKRLITKDA